MHTFDHYTIRLLGTTDATAFYELMRKNTTRLAAFFAGTVAKTRTEAATRQYVAEMEQRKQEKTYFPFLVTDQETGRIAGFIDVKNIDWSIPKAELGCFIDEDYAKQGISGKALPLVMTHLFQEMGFRKLFLRTHPSNHAARALAEKCGFELEGTLRSDYKTTAGELVDLHYYGKLGSTSSP